MRTYFQILVFRKNKKGEKGLISSVYHFLNYHFVFLNKHYLVVDKTIVIHSENTLYIQLIECKKKTKMNN